MGRVLSFIAVLLFLSFSSCSNKESDISLAFTSADYDKVILISDDILSSELDSDALYFKSASHYRLGNLKEAEDCSYLYLLISNKSDDNYFNASEILLRSTEDPERALYAGDILYSNGRLNRVDYILYYQALSESGEQNRADEFYSSISFTLSGYEKVLIALSSPFSPERIVTSLEELYSEEGISAHFKEMMKRVIPLFIEKKEEKMLLNLLSYGDGGDNSYALYMGDVYFSLGRLDEASLYWNKASSDFPVQARIRIRNL